MKDISKLMKKHDKQLVKTEVQEEFEKKEAAMKQEIKKLKG
jgi:hypothetical protein